jgi:anti-sigma B factor antagonist
MEAMPSILLVAAVPAVFEPVGAELAIAGLRTRCVASAVEAVEHVAAREYDVAIIAAEQHGPGAAGVVAQLKQLRPEMACIVVAPQPSPDEALRALSAGALAYMAGPPRAEALVELVKQRRRHALSATEEALKVQVEEHAGEPLLRLTGDLDVVTAPLLQRRVDELLGAGHHSLLIDAASLGFCDSTGLRVLLTTRRRLSERSGALRLLRTSDLLQRLLDMSHLDASLLSAG